MLLLPLTELLLLPLSLLLLLLPLLLLPAAAAASRYCWCSRLRQCMCLYSHSHSHSHSHRHHSHPLELALAPHTAALAPASRLLLLLLLLLLMLVARHSCALHALPRVLAYLFRVRPSRRPLTASTDSSAPCACVEPPLPAPVIGRCCAAAFPLPQKKKKLESVLPPPRSRPLSHTALAQRLCSWT